MYVPRATDPDTSLIYDPRWATTHSSLPKAATNTELFSDKMERASTLVANSVIQDIGIKKWNRLSKSTQAITEELTKLANLEDEYPYSMLTQFNSADYDRFVNDGERQLCYKSLTQGFKVRNDPFSTVPGIMVFMPSLQHSRGTEFVRECLSEAVEGRLFRGPWRFINLNIGVDIHLPGRGEKFQPDLVLLRDEEYVPYFTVEVNWLHYSVDDARRQVICPMERYRGRIRGGMLLYPLENEWRAEVYRYVNRATGEADINIPDGIENQERERVLIREALNSSDGDFAIYLQENKAYTLMSNDNPCEDVPLSMFDLFVEQYENVALYKSLRRPNATFWLDHNIFRRIFSKLPPEDRMNAARPMGG